MGRPAGSCKRLTAPMRTAAMMVADGTPIHAVAVEVGVDDITVRRWMQRDDMLEIYREHLSKLAAERYAAAMKKVEELSQSNNQWLALQAAQTLIGRNEAYASGQSAGAGIQITINGGQTGAPMMGMPDSPADDDDGSPADA